MIKIIAHIFDIVYFDNFDERLGDVLFVLSPQAGCVFDRGFSQKLQQTKKGFG